MAVPITAFFDNIAYGSIIIRSVFDALITSGVINGIGSMLQVVASASPAMTVEVGEGQAIVKGGMIALPVGGGRQVLSVAANSSGSARIDRVVAVLDFVGQTLTFVYKLGTTSPPTLQQDAVKWEISLAQVSVANGATSITTSNITDERFSLAFGGIAQTRALSIATPGIPSGIGAFAGVQHRTLYNASGTATGAPAAGRQWYITEAFGLASPGAADVTIGGKTAFTFGTTPTRAVLPLPILVDSGVSVVTQLGFGVRVLDVTQDPTRVGLIAQLVRAGANYTVPANQRLVILGAWTDYVSASSSDTSYLKDNVNNMPYWVSPLAITSVARSWGGLVETRPGYIDIESGMINAHVVPIIVPPGRTLVLDSLVSSGAHFNIFGYLESSGDTWVS